MHDKERLHVDSPGRDMQLTDKSGALSPGQRLLVHVRTKAAVDAAQLQTSWKTTSTKPCLSMR